LALLPHREQTLVRRVQALFFAPWLGSEPWTRFATPAPPLQTWLGCGDHRTPLTQWLGPRERIEAAEALRPARVPETAGQITSVEAHRIASGSRVPRHKGPIPMLGRLMAGSQALIAPHEGGQALFVR
jgi:hypothetical protein